MNKKTIYSTFTVGLKDGLPSVENCKSGLTGYACAKELNVAPSSVYKRTKEYEDQGFFITNDNIMVTFKKI